MAAQVLKRMNLFFLMTLTTWNLKVIKERSYEATLKNLAEENFVVVKFDRPTYHVHSHHYISLIDDM